MGKEDQKVFNVGDGIKTVTILEGAAPPYREPKILNIKGALDAPQRFLAGKKNLFKPINDHVTISITNGQIILYVNDKDHFGDIITGSISKTDELSQFRINSGHLWTIQELLTMVKRTKYFFPDEEDHKSVVNYLMNFKSKVTTEIEKIQATNGNAKNLMERFVNTDAPKQFKLKIPIFIGYPEETFRVEVCIDATSADLKLYLESEELFKLIEQKKREHLADQEAFFIAYGASVIYI